MNQEEISRLLEEAGRDCGVMLANLWLNPNEDLIACVKCTKGSTFQKDAVCSACRKQDKPKTGRKPETVAR